MPRRLRPNVTGLLRGDVQLSAISLNSIEGFLGSNDIRVLAVMNPTRIASSLRCQRLPRAVFRT